MRTNTDELAAVSVTESGKVGGITTTGGAVVVVGASVVGFVVVTNVVGFVVVGASVVGFVVVGVVVAAVGSGVVGAAVDVAFAWLVDNSATRRKATTRGSRKLCRLQPIAAGRQADTEYPAITCTKEMATRTYPLAQLILIAVIKRLLDGCVECCLFFVWGSKSDVYHHKERKCLNMAHLRKAKNMRKAKHDVSNPFR